ncbi:MAG: thioredoxin domain-containing protein [Parcubacteria group bacterium]|jgi:predicted DsbA family dithiol-disulfide isomerase
MLIFVAARTSQTKMAEDNKKIKNLISIAILLGGLFIGSLFVDVAQLLKGGGFSQKNLSQSEIFEANGKTWVAYGEPLVKVSVLTDDTCGAKCDPGEALVWLRRVMPTVSAQKLDYNSAEAKKIIAEFGLKTLPAFVFDSAVAKTDFYTQAQIIFEQKDDQYMLKTDELGLAPGRYLTMPQILESDATFGAADAKVKVVVYSDFQCPYCKIFWSTLRDTMKNYADKVWFDYKELPLPIHPQAGPAALAAQCALEQDKFWEYGDKLFANQSDWNTASDTQKFKDYAKVLNLDAAKFNSCLDSKKYQDRIDASVAEATAFGISGTPAIFINNQFKNGVTSADDLKTAIEQELAK